MMTFEDIQSIKFSLQNLQGDSSKIQFLDSLEIVTFNFPHLNLSPLTCRQEYLTKLLIALGQLHTLQGEASKDTQNTFFEILDHLELFYENMGGLAGYQLKAIELLDSCKKQPLNVSAETKNFLSPPYYDFQTSSNANINSLEKGSLSVPKFAEFYAVGGAGDRLNLVDEKTGIPLPAAVLKFMGKTLFESLIRDLEGREYLYYKLTGNKVETPIVCMTSQEKSNHHYITQLCEEKNWFGRSKDSFRFMVQPSVPLFSEDGKWLLKSPFSLYLKPGGHGVIWKMAVDQGIFEWCKERGFSKILVRQINNPLAATDNTLINALGVALIKPWSFGFVACPCQSNAAEGMDVLVEKISSNSFEYSITNIEYTEFAKHSFSAGAIFPANTNILIGDISAIEQNTKKTPIPGMLVNLKSSVNAYINGSIEEVKAARVESTMQNIADDFTLSVGSRLKDIDCEKLPTFITLNDRLKTISVTKKSYTPGQNILETPVGAFLAKLKNAKDLLENYCHIHSPKLPSDEDFAEKGPSFYFDYHPHLGPLFDIIGQKLRSGKLGHNSSLILEIAEVNIQNIDILGALKISAEPEGKCILHDCSIRNRGNKPLSYEDWKHGPNYSEGGESTTITIRGNGEFKAIGVVFTGNHAIEVDAGIELTVTQNKDGTLLWKQRRIEKPSWEWNYSFHKGLIHLTQVGF